MFLYFNKIQWIENSITSEKHNEKIGKNHGTKPWNLGFKRVLLDFLLLSGNQERLCQNKHVKIMLDFQIGSIQKILIIILFICEMHKYRHTLIESL